MGSSWTKKSIMRAICGITFNNGIRLKGLVHMLSLSERVDLLANLHAVVLPFAWS